MSTSAVLVRNSNVERPFRRRAALCAVLGLLSIFLFSGCEHGGSHGISPGYRAPYRPGGYYMGRAPHGYSRGIQHGFPRSGFGHGGYRGGGLRH